jgi:hypothetical protein
MGFARPSGFCDPFPNTGWSPDFGFWMSGARHSGYSRSGNLASAGTHARELSCSGESSSGRDASGRRCVSGFSGGAYGDPGTAIVAWIVLGLIAGFLDSRLLTKLAKACGLLSFLVRWRTSRAWDADSTRRTGTYSRLSLISPSGRASIRCSYVVHLLY